MTGKVKDKYGFSRGRGIGLFVVAILSIVGIANSIVRLCMGDSIAFSISPIIIYVAIIFYGVYGYKIPHGNLLKYTMLLFAILLVVKLDGGTTYDITNALLGIAAIAIAFISGRLDRYKQVMIISLVAFGLILTTAIIGQAGGVSSEKDTKNEQAAPAMEEESTEAEGEALVVPEASVKSAMLSGTVLESDDAEAPALAGAEAPDGEAAPPEDGENNPDHSAANESKIMSFISGFSTTIQWGALILVYTTRYELHKEAGLEDKKKA